jgi:hypothetical protein
MLEFWLTVFALWLMAMPFVCLAAWSMSKLLTGEPPRGWWNNR